MINKNCFHIAFVGMVCMLTSCLGDDSTFDTITYEDTAITSFTLGTIKVNTVTGKEEDGSDKITTTSYTGSNTPVYIDHFGYEEGGKLYGEITNPDSLPAGSEMKFQATVQTRNNTVVQYQKWSDDAVNGQWNLFTSSEEVDFSDKLRFRVISTGGEYKRYYHVNIVAHSEPADSFQWKTLPAKEAFSGAQTLKGTATSKALFVLADGKLYKSGSLDYGTNWTTVNAVEGNSLVSMNDSLFVFGGGSLAYLSADGSVLNTKSGQTDISTLIGGCGNELYALGTDGKIKVCKDRKAGTWADDKVEGNEYYDNSHRIPQKDISYAVMQDSEGRGHIVVAGNMADGVLAEDTCAVVWSKVVDEKDPECWIYNETTYRKDNHLQRLANLSVAGYYRNCMIAIGGKPLVEGMVEKPYSKIYWSEDGGNVWTERKGLRMPAVISAEKTALIVADAKGYFYIITADGGKIFRGKLNNATWKSNEIVVGKN